MSTTEKWKASAEQIVGKAVRKTAHALGKEKTALKGAGLEARGKARHLKEKTKDAFKH
ncbi:hypothetical protein ACIRTB_13230 [Streptomyces sp. NPDC101158]|uniref:hypothetical protein n=1 Tax=Streptomyces sp. NPDC101158 TaxID=3366117 RepID=UPI0038182D6F